jgi:hypothetical protein
LFPSVARLFPRRGPGARAARQPINSVYDSSLRTHAPWPTTNPT